MEFHWNKEAHLPDFIRLNKHWIEKYFYLEEIDEQLFSDPSIIYRNGGSIISVTENNRVLGVCALMKETDSVCELARMAVAETEQGKGVGRLILHEIANRAVQTGTKKVFLVSNTKLKAAIKLYLKDGFQIVSEGQHPIYQRGNIVMEKYF